MDRITYDEYLRAFNARDYHRVLSYYAPAFEISFAGYRLTTRAQVLDFYGFLHAHVREEIRVSAYVASSSMAAMEADVRLEGVADLTAEMLAARGLGRLQPLRAGEVVVIPQFIHYHLQDGKITKAYCAVFLPPTGD